MTSPPLCPLHPDVLLGNFRFIRAMLDNDDPRPAREQFDAHYQHGGGWRPMNGLTLGKDKCLHSPGDPPIHPLAAMLLHKDEYIIIFEHDIVAIVRGESFEACRMD